MQMPFGNVRASTMVALLCLVGCVSEPVGSAPPGPIFTRMYTFAPTDSSLRIDINASSTSLFHNVDLTLSREPSLDNTNRPDGIPEDWVAYATGSYFFGTEELMGDLEKWSDDTLRWEHVGEVDSWTGDSTLYLVR